MHPILFSLGPLTIHTYGFFVAIGFLVAVSIIQKLSKTSRIDPQKMVDLAFWTLLVGFVGARLLFVWTRFDFFVHSPLEILKVWEGGLVFYGGLITGLPFVVLYVRRHNLPVWKVMDVFFVAIPLAHAFGRLGCLSAGCCYGRPTGSDWGVLLHSDLVDEHLRGIPLHPTQLYEAVALAALFLGLGWIYRHKRFDGQVAITYLMAYPVIRSIVEIFRGDLVRGFVIDQILSTSQFISLIVFVLAWILLNNRLKANKR